MLCLTDTPVRRGPLVAVLWQGQGSQSGPGGALAAGRLRLVQPAVVAALQRSLVVGVLGLAHHREGHPAERLQEKKLPGVTALDLAVFIYLFCCYWERGWWGRVGKGWSGVWGWMGRGKDMHVACWVLLIAESRRKPQSVASEVDLRERKGEKRAKEKGRVDVSERV